MGRNAENVGQTGVIAKFGHFGDEILMGAHHEIAPFLPNRQHLDRMLFLLLIQDEA
jgi:hypothetical protein